MDYELVTKVKNRKENIKIMNVTSSGDGVFMLARIQALAQLYEKVTVKEITPYKYEVIGHNVK